MALSKATQRLTRELQELKAHPSAGVRIVPTDNLFVCNMEISGPSGTPYAGGTFKFTVTFSASYPLEAPKVKCDTKMYHCNINQVGDVCLNILKEDWSPLMTVAGIGAALQQLLSEPNPNSPLDPEVGTLFVMDNKEYIRRARLYTKKFAL